LSFGVALSIFLFRDKGPLDIIIVRQLLPAYICFQHPIIFFLNYSVILDSLLKGRRWVLWLNYSNFIGGTVHVSLVRAAVGDWK